jgi:thymidylate synthase
MRVYSTFENARERYREAFLSPAAIPVKGTKWQGIDISSKPEMATRELLNQSLSVPLRGLEDLNYWAVDTKANLPWANVHFEERVGGEPLNPGESWKSWPWGHSADKFRDAASGQFDHTYMERFWPKHAGKTSDGTLADVDKDDGEGGWYSSRKNRGIRFEYGDLNDLLETLQKDPLTRQAYLPVWFPEDGTCTGRRPCTLGYHFINRYDYLHITYYIRSCDFIRHWGDDCYLAVRLLLWVLDRLRERDKRWGLVRPGMYTMHIVSLHLFENDYRTLANEVQAHIATAKSAAGNP